jgi:hypothetical protein
MLRNGHVFSVTLCCALSVLSSNPTFAQETTRCSIEISTPKKGDKVAVKTQIAGSATVPAGMHLWVFARKSGQSNWWPQGGGRTEVASSGRWVSDGTFGDENDAAKDAGAPFQVTAVIVDAATEARLTSYVEMTEKTLKYPGTRLPAAPPTGCALKEYVIVTRE